MSQAFDEYQTLQDEGQDSPLALVGILVMALTSAAIIANALFMQPQSAELDMIRAAKSGMQQHDSGVMTRNKSTHSPAQSAALKQDHVALTLSIQRQLTMAGYYVGPLDGLEGVQTREAVLAFQDAVGMPATGRVSIELHDILTGRTPIQGPVRTQVQTPVQPQAQPNTTGTIVTTTKVDQPRTTNLTTLPKARPKTTTKRLAVMPPVPSQRSSQTNAPVPPETIGSLEADPVLAKVQSALSRFGYGNLTVDGLMGEKTRAAIANFQRSRGHPVTGTLNDRLLQEMMIMGYLDLG